MLQAYGLGSSHPPQLTLRSKASTPKRDWYFIAEQPAPAPQFALPEGCAALRIVLVTVLRVSRSCELFPDGFDLHLLPLQLTLPSKASTTNRPYQTAKTDEHTLNPRP